MEKLTKKELRELKKQEFAEQLKKESRGKLVKQVGIWVSVFAVVILSVFGLMQLANNSSSSSSVLSSSVEIPAVSDKDITVGNKQAKTILIEYSDFQCPACALYHNYINQLLNDYNGKILFVYRNFPLPQHKNAVLAAQIAYAAHLQGNFIEMQNSLFDNQKDWAEIDALDTFLSYASKLKLDINKLKVDMNSDQTNKIIEEQKTSAVSLGINSTPTFFLNNKQIQNPRSYEEFKQLIEEELKK